MNKSEQNTGQRNEVQEILDEINQHLEILTGSEKYFIKHITGCSVVLESQKERIRKIYYEER